MTQYNRIMLGKAGCFFEDCLKGNYIGVDFDIKEDLSSNLPDDWKQFNKKYVPIWKASHPDKGNVSAGLSCGFLWTTCKGLKKGAVVLSPNGNNEYHIGLIESDYYYVPDENLPHRRRVHWLIFSKKVIFNSQSSLPTWNGIGKFGANNVYYTQERSKYVGNSLCRTRITSGRTALYPTGGTPVENRSSSHGKKVTESTRHFWFEEVSRQHRPGHRSRRPAR